MNYCRLMIRNVRGVLLETQGLIRSLLQTEETDSDNKRIYQSKPGKEVSQMKRGFTLVEIMIVVAIISLLVAIAVPNIARSRLSANDTAALGSIRTIATAFESYSAANGLYPPSEAALTRDSRPPYYSRTYNGNLVAGYEYDLFPAADQRSYTIFAIPPDAVRGSFCYAATTGGTMWRRNFATGACVAAAATNCAVAPWTTNF
jgi:type IV pilus assembly protein PilA